MDQRYKETFAEVRETHHEKETMDFTGSEDLMAFRKGMYNKEGSHTMRRPCESLNIIVLSSFKPVSSGGEREIRTHAESHPSGKRENKIFCLKKCQRGNRSHKEGRAL